MTESDQKWMKSEFDRVHDTMKTFKETCDMRINGLEKWVVNVEKKTDNNSKYIWIGVGIFTLISAVLGAFEFIIKI